MPTPAGIALAEDLQAEAVPAESVHKHATKSETTSTISLKHN